LEHNFSLVLADAQKEFISHYKDFPRILLQALNGFLY